MLVPTRSCLRVNSCEGDLPISELSSCCCPTRICRLSTASVAGACQANTPKAATIGRGICMAERPDVLNQNVSSTPHLAKKLPNTGVRTATPGAIVAQYKCEVVPGGASCYSCVGYHCVGSSSQ